FHVTGVQTCALPICDQPDAAQQRSQAGSARRRLRLFVRHQSVLCTPPRMRSIRAVASASERRTIAFFTSCHRFSGPPVRGAARRHIQRTQRTHLSTSFDSFGLAEPILRAVTELGYRAPTPIQAQAIPIVMQGRAVMGAARTGTGKTACFALPILQRLMPHANASAAPARPPVPALILAPTREPADQISANGREYAKYTGLKSAVVFGGVDIKPQIAALRQGCEVL